MEGIRSQGGTQLSMILDSYMEIDGFLGIIWNLNVFNDKESVCFDFCMCPIYTVGRMLTS